MPNLPHAATPQMATRREAVVPLLSRQENVFAPIARFGVTNGHSGKALANAPPDAHCQVDHAETAGRGHGSEALIQPNFGCRRGQRSWFGVRFGGTSALPRRRENVDCGPPCATRLTHPSTGLAPRAHSLRRSEPACVVRFSQRWTKRNYCDPSGDSVGTGVGKRGGSPSMASNAGPGVESCDNVQTRTFRSSPAETRCEPSGEKRRARTGPLW